MTSSQNALLAGARTHCWLIPAAILLCAPALAVAGPDTAKLVVVIYPHESDGAPGIVLVNRAIRATFAEQSTLGPIDIRNEYVDATRLQDAEFMRAHTSMLRQKYAGKKVDLVIAGLSSGLDFALAVREEVFPGVPIVHVLVDRWEVAARHLPKDVVGVPIRMDLTGTLDTALKLQPGTRRVFVITGSSPFDQIWEGRARQEFGPFADRLEFVYLAGLPMDELLGRVANLPNHSIIYYLHVFKDGVGKDFVPADALQCIAAQANAPVYTHVDTFVDRGAVGGSVYAHETEGAIAARLGLRVLSGDRPESIAIAKSNHTSYLFNARQLHRWRISEDRLPAGSVVRFQEPTFLDRYRWHIVGVLSLCGVQAALIAWLIAQRAKRRRADSALEESETRFRLMADSAPVLIWTSGVDKECTYCNRPWLDFTGRRLEQELGAGWSESVHADDQLRCFDVYSSAFDRREPFVIEYRLRRHDGEYRWILDQGGPRFTADRRFLGYVGACADVTERRRAEHELRANQRELRRLAGQLIEAQEAERRRVARELHDDLSQGLAVLSLELDMFARRPSESAAELVERLQTLSASVRELSSAVHALSHQLHPSKLEHLGLDAALRGLCAEFGQHHDLQVRYTSSTIAVKFPEAISVCVYRITQEALRNVIKHADTDRVAVELTGSPNRLRLRISDNGAGFDPTVHGHAGLGLVSMRERLALVGGRIKIDSKPGDGTRIEICVPVPAPETPNDGGTAPGPCGSELIAAGVNTEELS